MDRWPSVPAELKYIELRLPGTFRELMANSSFSDDEVGKIVRCLALDTDFFITQKIEAEVMYYRQILYQKNQVRMRVAALRKRQKEAKAGVLSSSSDSSRSRNDRVTVTPDEKCYDAAGTVPQKTLSKLKEETPPIVPLEKKALSSLEKGTDVGVVCQHADAVAVMIQPELFSTASQQKQLVASKSCDRSASTGSAGNPELDMHQDIGSDPRGSCGRSDARVDYAWIPEKFAIFWAKYPKKVAKAAASKAFTKIIKSQKDVDKFMETLIASLNWWINHDQWKKDNGRFIPNAATWLNRGSWEDSSYNNGSDKEFVGSDEFTNELMKRMEAGGYV